MESCSICLEPLEGSKSLCSDCIRSNLEARKEAVRDRKTVLQLLCNERKILKQRITSHLESNKHQLQECYDQNLNAAKLQSMRDTTLRFAEETVKKEEEQVEAMRADIAQRREALAKGKEALALLKQQLEEKRAQRAAGTPPRTSTTTTMTTSSINSPRPKPTTNTSTTTSASTTTNTTSTLKPTTTTSTTLASPRPTTTTTTTTSPKPTTTSTTNTTTSPKPTTNTKPSMATSKSTSVLPKPTTSTSSSTRSPSSSSSSSLSRSLTRATSYSVVPSPTRNLSLTPEAELYQTKQKLAQVRRAIISELLSFFPINPSPTASETETVILNVTMPNSGVYTSYRPDALSTALGYVAHVVYLVGCYLGVTYPWKIEFAGARSAMWNPFDGKRYPLYGERYSDIEPGLILLNRAIVYLCCSQGVYVPLSSQRHTLPNLLSVLRCPTLGLPGPVESTNPEHIIQITRPPLRVIEPPSPVKPKLKLTSPETEKRNKQDDKDKGKDKGQEEDDDADFIVVEHSIPTPEQSDEIDQFERAMFQDHT